MKTQKLHRLFALITGVIFIALISGCASKPDPHAVLKAEQEAISKLYHGKAADINGNVYKTIIIGDQEWFAENLKTTFYNDSSAIPNIKDNGEWSKLSAGAYCWYDNDPDNGRIYGALYNWYAVDTGKLCPEGWRVSTDADWRKLIDSLGGDEIAGGKLKTTGTIKAGDGLWHDPNEGATNETGFSALPGGFRRANHGLFGNIGHYGYWWSSREHSKHHAWRRYIGKGYAIIGRYFLHKRNGFSVRCVRDVVRTEDE